MRAAVTPRTRALVRSVFERLNYRRLGPVYCYEGGDEFWAAKRAPCVRLGLRLAQALVGRLPTGGRSLYVGAGVAELPCLLAEVAEAGRRVEPYNLRTREVAELNRACRGLIQFDGRDASVAKGRFDHVWIVSVLNDPERFAHLSALSYGQASPVSFDPDAYRRERRVAQAIVDRCLAKLSVPGWVTTSTEEVVWIADWCHRRGTPYRVGRECYPTALVGDPVCFLEIGCTRFRRGSTATSEPDRRDIGRRS